MRWLIIILLALWVGAAYPGEEGTAGGGLPGPLNGCGTDPNGLPKPCL